VLNALFQHPLGSLRPLRRKFIQWSQDSLRTNLISGGGHRVLNYPFDTSICDGPVAER
jgi:hypothetical protein